MGRRIASLGVAAMVTASIWGATGAHAAEADSCDPGAPPEGTFVTISGSRIDIYPENVVPYAGAVAGWAGAYVACLRAENDRWIFCVPNHVAANRPTVTVDPDTGHVSIDLHELGNIAC